MTREAYVTGDAERGTLSLGQAAVFATEIKPVEAIIDQLLAEAAAAQERLNARVAEGRRAAE